MVITLTSLRVTGLPCFASRMRVLSSLWSACQLMNCSTSTKLVGCSYSSSSFALLAFLASLPMVNDQFEMSCRVLPACCRSSASRVSCRYAIACLILQSLAFCIDASIDPPFIAWRYWSRALGFSSSFSQSGVGSAKYRKRLTSLQICRASFSDLDRPCLEVRCCRKLTRNVWSA